MTSKPYFNQTDWTHIADCKECQDKLNEVFEEVFRQ